MFRRKEDEDPFAALNEASERGATRMTSGELESGAAKAADAFGSMGKRPTRAEAVAASVEAATGAGGKGRMRGPAVISALVLLVIVASLGLTAQMIIHSERSVESVDARAGDNSSPGA